MSTGFTLHPISLSLRAPLRTAHGEIGAREGWSVRFEAEGAVGWGEALPLPEFGTESPQACERVLRAELARRAAVPVSTEQDVERAVSGLEDTPCARFAIETALLDWLAQRAGRPLSALLGERTTSRVQVNALLSGSTPEALAEEARAAPAAGFGTVKVKVAGRALREDLARVFAVREAVGPAVKLRVDANGGWTASEAIEALEQLSPARLELCEQPTPAGDLEGLGQVHARGVCRVAADEALLLPGAAEVLLSRRLCDVLVLKPMALGGLSRARALARRALAAGIDAYVTSLIDGEIARAAAAHLASVLPTALAHGLATGALLTSPGPTRWLCPAQGLLAMPTAPGLGLEAVR